MNGSEIATRASIFGDMTIGDCLGRLERNRAVEPAKPVDPQALALAAAEISGVEDQAMDRLIGTLHARSTGGAALESLDEDPERWDGMA